MGITPLAMDSDGISYENPRGYYRAQKRLKHWQRAQARRTPGNRGWWEAQSRIDAVHRRIMGLRNNAHHHVSRTLVTKYHTLRIETLNVKGMIKAGLQPKALSDDAMSNLLSQIRYKGQWHGTHIVPESRKYPSSKTCSACNEVNKKLARQPRWTCPGCGATHDRNENAARNLLKLARLAVGESVTLPDGEALANSDPTNGDFTRGGTDPDEGRTKPRTTDSHQLMLDL